MEAETMKLEQKARNGIIRFLLLCVIMIFFSFSVHGQALGDVNTSGSIDIVDALLVAQYYVGMIPANFDVTKADVNCSGVADIVDALLIARYYVGLISVFPCAEPTSVPGGSYVIHVKSERTNVGVLELNVPISYSGSYSSTSMATPFDIGPYTAPFTVTLNAPFTYYYNSKLHIISGFRSEAGSYSGSTATYTVDDTRPEITVWAEYYEDLAATPTPTPPSSTPNPTP